MKVAENQPGELIAMLRQHRRGIAVFFLIIFAGLIVDSCSYYRKKVLYRGEITLDIINKNLNKDKHFVLVTETETWEAKDITINDDMTLSMDLASIKSTLLENKLDYLKYNTKTRVKKDNDILQHLVIMHLLEDSSYLAGNINLTISDIGKLEVYDPDVGKSIVVVALPTLAFIGLIAIIGSSNKKNSSNSSSSCPFLYVYDGENYQLAAETFGGAIYPGLERSDFVKLAMAQPEDGFYKIKIKNELEERQFINKVRLIEAKVPDHKSLNIDQNGLIHTIGSPISTSYVVSSSQQNYTSQLASIDANQYYFNDRENDNSLTLSFDKPASIKRGKLILRAKNTIWFDYVFGEFLKLFGNSYNTFAQNQKQKTTKQMVQWSEDQLLPLTVSVFKNDHWVEVEQIQAIGPLADARDIIVPLDLSEITDENLRVKLSTGFFFWEVDYAGMDYSIDEAVETRYAFPAFAEFNSVKVSNSALNNDDNLYIVENEVGDEIALKFATQFKDNVKTTVFLEVSGYYTHIRDFKTDPEFKKLQTFRNPGRLSEFSGELFHYYTSPLLAKNIIQD